MNAWTCAAVTSVADVGICAFAEDAMSAGSAEHHAFAIENIFPRLGRVRSTAQVLDMLG